ncbi:MAG: YIP1 family protein [Acidobacteriota bacterium]|nr:YIP1 family protein [Acidobacteriota bacterium]
MASEEVNPQNVTETGAFGRVVGALVSPRPTFESIARKPTWLLPLLLLLAINLVLIFSFSHRIGWRGIIEKQLANNSQFQQLSPAEQQQRIARALKIAPMLGYLGGTVGNVIVVLIIAGIFLAAFNVVFGGGIGFRQSLGITTHSFMPGILKGLIGLVVVWVRPPEGVNLQNLVMSNVGAFLLAGEPLWLQTLSSSLDLFVFWIIALLAIGYTAASSSRKVKFGSALAVVVVIWLVFLLGWVGVLAAIG